ncbi:bifunctional heptose 7-phosphate kinase/heptose 1-phosphate adenyltransferase [Candidatus Puniceispirillum sp.]|nr:bifunctional heptose 7-phosphate kinase/heptose 1-phosphate adenyltransferase [Candidatus Puniceispirillum sp.]
MNINIANAARLFCLLQAKKVLVLGDVMLDRFVDGSVTRISPEAPVPILSQSRVRQMPGGAANVACNLAQMGLHVHLVGVCGDDEVGKSLHDELAKLPNIHFDPVTIIGRATSLKTRFRAGSQQILRVDDEVTSDIDSAAAKQFSKYVLPAIHDADLVVLSDYAKGSLPVLLLEKIIGHAKAKGKMIIADPKRADISAYSGVDLLTPNLAELQNTTDQILSSIETIGQTATALAKEFGIGSILTTMSARGMMLSRADGTQFHDPASARDIFDVSGAGDTVVAMIAGAFVAGADLEDAVRLANHAASVAVGKSGTAIVAPGEILAHLAGPPPQTDWPSIAMQCTNWRGAGQKIAFANGCFDLLHPGHIHLLREAARNTDKLVVGLNGDASVKRLKGVRRPTQSAELRSAVLAALPFVDAVAVFDEDTPFELIATLQPDIIVKGGDYTADQVVGADIVAARGGRVLIISTLEGHATSKLITA